MILEKLIVEYKYDMDDLAREIQKEEYWEFDWYDINEQIHRFTGVQGFVDFLVKIPDHLAKKFEGFDRDSLEFCLIHRDNDYYYDDPPDLRTFHVKFKALETDAALDRRIKLAEMAAKLILDHERDEYKVYLMLKEKFNKREQK